MSIDGVHSVENFEIIDIVDDSQPYPTLMGLEWAFDNQTIINLKRREMIFEVRDLKVTTPLDPTKGTRYIEPTKGNEIENLYNMTVRMDDYVNPTTDGALSWRRISLCVWTQRKVWNIGSRGCMNNPPDHLLALLDHCVGLERSYVTHLSMMV
jgi:hypothetical protein